MRYSTSPSVYLEIVGTAAVSDSCAPVGAVLTNPIVAVPPGVLMTYSPQFPFTVGQEYTDPNGVIGGQFLGFKKSLNIAELECPTFGVGPATSANGRVYRTYGHPYLPIIIPPQQILSLDPAWEKYCVDFLSYSPGLRSFAIFDPPRILTPVAALLPPSTPAPAIVSASRTSDPLLTEKPQIQPARKTSPSIPAATVVPVTHGLSPSEPAPSLPVIVVETPPNDPEIPGSRASQNPAPLITPSVDSEIPSHAELTLSLPPSGQEQVHDLKDKLPSLGAIIFSAFGRGDSLTGKSANQVSTLLVPQPAAHELTVDGQKVTAVDPSSFAVGGNTYSAGGAAAVLSNGVLFINPPTEAGNDNPGINGFHSVGRPIFPQVVTVAGHIFTADPSEIAIAGTTLLPDGPGIVISGTSISLAPSGTLFLDGSPVPLAHDPARPSSFVLTIGGQAVTAKPAGFAFAGTKLVPGGTPITISGTPVSLNPSGVLFIASSSTNLLAPISLSKTFMVGSHTFTADSTGIRFAGSTLLPGGPAITVSGTAVSLDPSRVLIVGSSRLDLSAKAAKTFARDVFTAGGLTFTAESSAIVVDGTTLVPGEPAVTIAGMPISLKAGKDPGVLLIGTSTINLPVHTPSPNILTAGGLTFNSESSMIIVDGTTLLPGGPGATVSGIPISLKAGKDSEVLIMGTSTINLPAHTPMPKIFTVGGLTFTAQPSGVMIGGSMLVPGGSGVTISGTPVSLEPGGSSLMVGSREVPLATSPSTTGGSATLLRFEGAQARSVEMPSFWRGVGLLGVLCIVVIMGGG
ncbi:hypothetical protein MMC07_002261 [Pseudocyphellaria aurata]|nr:hypothetical protein [Pseudocyphellaria aurata]